jgi:predicted RNA binding protein YcfA (HicA-like mRNA interferase family)
MSEHLPTVSGRTLVRVLTQYGWREVRQRGSHIIMYNSSAGQGISVPNHRELSTGTLRSLLKQAGVSPQEFRKLL